MFPVKETRINVRTNPQTKRELEIAAQLKGLTVSSLVNYAVTQVIREEKERDPAAFRRGGQVLATAAPTTIKDKTTTQAKRRSQK